MSDPIVRARNGDTEFFKRVDVYWILNLRDEEEQCSVLSICVRFEHIQCSKVILQRCPSLLYQQSVSGYTALHYAVRSGILAFVKLLIHGAEKMLLRMRDKYGDAPVMDAVRGRQLEMVKLLIQADPDYEVPKNNDGNTLLWHALKFSYGESSDDISVKIRRLLIEKQPSQCRVRVGDRGQTALDNATYEGDLGAIKDIIEFCPDCTFIVNYAGENFLHIAVVREHVHVVEYIVKEIEIVAVLLNSRNKHGDTPLDIATKTGNRKIITCFQDAPTIAGYENEREKELCVPPNHVVLYRVLVRNFGEIVPPHLSLSLDEFLCFVFEMFYVATNTITQQLISFWEEKVEYYTCVGLQVSWLQKHVTRFRDWLAKKNEHINHLEDKIKAKRKEITAREMELIANKKKKLFPLKEEITAKKKELSSLRVELKRQHRYEIAAKEMELSSLHVELQQLHHDFGFAILDD